VSDEPNRIWDDVGEHTGRTFTRVKLRSDGASGFHIVGSAAYVELDLHSSAAAAELRELFDRIEKRLREADEAVK
jgi:hypothetical protein